MDAIVLTMVSAAAVIPAAALTIRAIARLPKIPVVEASIIAILASVAAVTISELRGVELVPWVVAVTMVLWIGFLLIFPTDRCLRLPRARARQSRPAMLATLRSRGRCGKLSVGELATKRVDHRGVMGERVGIDAAEDFRCRGVIGHHDPVPPFGCQLWVRHATVRAGGRDSDGASAQAPMRSRRSSGRVRSIPGQRGRRIPCKGSQ